MKRTIDKRYENRDLIPPGRPSYPLWFRVGAFVGFLAWLAGIVFSTWVILAILEILRNWN